MTGQEEIQRARAAGFSDEEIATGIAAEKAKAVKAGFTTEDVDAYYGNPPFDPQPVQDFVKANLDAQGPKQATDFTEALEAGLQMSVSGLLSRGKAPEKVLGPDTPRMSRIAGNIAQLAGDLPAIMGGTALGIEGGPVTMFGGAMALPMGLRKILMDKYEKGEVTNFSDFWDRLSGAVIETTKGLVTGAAAGKAGQLVQAAPIVSQAAKTAATLGAEVTTMTTVGAALEGHIPSADDFIDTALTLGFVKGTTRAAQKLREIYHRTGTTPAQVAEDVQKDPTILQDLSSHDRTLPKAYEDALLDNMAKAQNAGEPVAGRGYVERRPTGAFVEMKPNPSITDLAKAQQYAVEQTSKAGAFREQAYAQQRLHQEGTIVERPITEQEEVKQYASLAGDQVAIDRRTGSEIWDTEYAPYWYRKILDLPEFKTSQNPLGLAPWEVDASLRRLRETGVPKNKIDRAVLDSVVNEQELIRAVQSLPKTVPDTQTERSQYGNERAFRTAEEILQERNVLRSAEDMISRTEKPTIREKVYIMPKGRGPAISHDDMNEIHQELKEHGIVWNAEGQGKPTWEENIPVGDAQQQILSRIVQTEPGSERLTLSALYTSVFDNLNPIRKDMKTVGAEKLPTALNAYDLQRLTRGIMGKGQQFLKHGAFDFDTYATKTRGYEQILEPVKNDLDGFRAYMAAKRTIEKEGQGIRTGFPLDAAKKVVEEGRSKYEKVFQERLQYRSAMLDYLEQSGILNAAKRAAFEKANQDYVPFYRMFELENQEPVESRSTSTAQVKDPIKKMTGSEAKIIDPIVSDIKDTFLFIGLAERNAARQAFVKLGPDLAELVRAKSDPVSKQEIQAVVKQYGVGEEAARATAALRPSSLRAADNELVVYENGERNVYKVNPGVAEAFEDMDRTGSHMLVNMLLNTPASVLRAGVTLSPEFMGRNIMRDAVSAFLYAGSNPIKTVKGGISILKQDTAFQNWLKGGGANATMVAIDRDYISSHIFKLNPETGIAERALNVVKTPLELLRIMSEFVENATRVGAVRSELQTAKDKATIQAMSMIAREATVDFGRHGRDLQAMSKMTAFLNPALQGIDRFNRAMKADPVGMTAKAFGAITIPSIALWWANRDDKEIQELPRWQKDLFWLVRVPIPEALGFGSSAILRIPKPHEPGILFGTLWERMLDKFVDENPDAMRDFDRTMLGVFIPSLVPTSMVPVVEQFANRSSFTGGPLVPANVEKLLPEYQYTEYTSETAKALGKIFGAFPGMEKQAVGNENFIGGVARALTTPAYVENYVRQWTGGIGMYVLQLSDSALRDVGLVPDPVLPASTLADIPFIKAFVARYPSANTRSIQDFYSNYYVSKRYYDTIMAKAAEGDPVAAQLMQAHPDVMVQLDGIRETLTDMSKLVHDLNKNPDMTRSDKRQLIDTIYSNMIAIAQEGNRIFKEEVAQ